MFAGGKFSVIRKQNIISTDISLNNDAHMYNNLLNYVHIYYLKIDEKVSTFKVKQFIMNECHR